MCSEFTQNQTRTRRTSQSNNQRSAAASRNPRRSADGQTDLKFCRFFSVLNTQFSYKFKRIFRKSRRFEILGRTPQKRNARNVFRVFYNCFCFLRGLYARQSETRWRFSPFTASPREETGFSRAGAGTWPCAGLWDAFLLTSVVKSDCIHLGLGASLPAYGSFLWLFSSVRSA